MAHLLRILGTSSGAPFMALILSSGLSAQVEGTGPKPTIPGRRVLTGTLTSAIPSKTFSAPLAPGLYRLTYLSAAAPAVLQVVVDGVVVGSAAHTQPFATVMRIVNGQLKGTVDLAPTGLCSSDVVGDGDCAGQKLHFRLSRQGVVTIKVNGRPAKPAPFQLLLDPLQVAPLPEELSVNTVLNSYLAFGDGAQGAPPIASYRLHVQPGQRVGILVGSPDFTSTVEARSSSGALVTTNSGFNDLLDPCREVKIDRLPKFDPYSQTNSYIVVDAPQNDTYVINVRAHFAGETGLFILRTFDLTDPTIEPKQMRSGLLGRGVNEFVVSIPSGWQSGGSRIVGYSPVPITIVLKDMSGRQLATSVTRLAAVCCERRQPSRRFSRKARY